MVAFVLSSCTIPLDTLGKWRSNARLTRSGKTKNIRIGLISEDGWLTMTVENDGSDFAVETSCGEGMGLKIMRHRAEVINGSLDICKRAEGGTIVTCTLSNKEGPQQGR